MNSILSARPLAAGLLALSLLGTGAAVAVASVDPAPGDAVTEPEASTLPALTATSSDLAVGHWEEFRIEGRTQAILPGTSITLQQKQGERWVSLPAQTTVRNDGSYTLRAKLGIRGENRLRMAAAGTMSEPFTVIVY